jgi:ABC-2 type transport system permease protein
MAVFGLASISLFCGMLIAKDRSTSFLMRLFTSPLSASDFILGYTSPMLPIAVMQCAICFAVSIFLGLAMNVNVLVAIAVLIPAVVLFIGIGLMAGTVLTDRQVGVMVGAGLTNACAWLSGIWFAPGLVGGWFESVAYVLPFVYAVNTARAAIVGDYAAIFPQLWWVIGYAVVIMTTAIFIFRKKMDNDDM